MSRNEPSIKEDNSITFAEFLENTPPNQVCEIADLTNQGLSTNFYLSKPELQLHCSHESCNGMRFFRPTENDSPLIYQNNETDVFLEYVCSNCQNSYKTFALVLKRPRADETGLCKKYGETPAYGPPTPSRLIKMIGPDRDLFLKGRQCENQGLGIGAFVYYRRVIENQKNRILDQIIKVSQKLSAPPEHIRTLEAAQKETQFSKALKSVKDSTPEALLVNGHNPLLLLHSALSDGLHDRDDEHCLEIAHSVRVILGELSERLSQALKDEKSLNDALKHLSQIKSNDQSGK